MAIPLHRYTYGFTVVTGVNDKLDFVDAGSATKTATLTANDYTPGALAGELQRAMRAAAPANNDPVVTYDPVLMKFTIAGVAVFQLLFGTAPSGSSCGNLFGFLTGGGAGNDKTGAATYTGAAVGANLGSGQTAAGTVWTCAEPAQFISPVTAPVESGLATGLSASLVKRDVRATMNLTDGKQMETVWINTTKRVEISLWALIASEQVKAEALLDWIERGRPVLWQPDSTINLGMRLRLDVGSGIKIGDSYEWLTRSEVTYDRLTMLEDTTA